MSAKPRRAVATVAALALVLVLTACQQTQSDVRRDAEFAKSCTDAGGRVYYIGFTSEIIRCDFTTTEEGQ